MTSDIRTTNASRSRATLQSTAKSVNLLDDDDPDAPTTTSQLTTTNRPSSSVTNAATSTVSSTSSTTSRASTTAAADVSETRSQSSSTLRTSETTVSAPTTPLATTTAASSTSGAQSFANQLTSVRYEGYDSDSMTAAFMKLDASNLSTNNDMESYINQAKHHLRVAADNISRALEGEDTEALLSQADSLVQQAYEMLGEGSGASSDDAAAVGEELLSSIDQSATWDTLYDSASRDITAAAEDYQAAEEAKANGDMDTYNTLMAKADTEESNARQIMEAVGITVSDADAKALGELALEMKANGDDGNVITEYLDQHPEAAESLLPADVYDSVKDQGGQAIVDAIKDNQAALGGDNTGTALAIAASYGDATAMEELAAQNPELANNSALSGAASLLAEAYSLRTRAYEIEEAKLDADNALHEGKTQKGQYGVQMRNQEGQDQVLRRLFALTGGTRPDQQMREDRGIAANQARSEVVRLIRDQVELDSASTARARPIQG